ncbi:MAG: TonB-dependent receptor [Bacteroidales bacterium]|nr:TonB-dependent receptor [Bacteroidales bacterium]
MYGFKHILCIAAVLLVPLFGPLPAFGGGSGRQQPQEVLVKGIVTDDTGAALVGAGIVSGPGTGVLSGLDGSYSISVPAGTTLEVSFIGCKSVYYKVPEGESEVVFNVRMESDAESLDDVVVIAYGVRKKGTVAGSVAVVKSDKLETTPTAAFDQALQGQVTGLTVLSNSGEPSATAEMKIRGTNSINSGTAPLYILDGAAISASDFNTINPSDIESISVLKDAASTSIYGARAANGVIVITTRRGRMSDRPSVNFRTQLGISQIAGDNWQIMNTEERILYEKEIGLTAGKNYDLLGRIDINWLDEVFNRAALLQNYELSVSGASDKTNYYISGGFYDQQGTAVASGFRRYSLRMNTEQNAASWLRLGTNTQLNYQDIEQADAGIPSTIAPISAAQFMMPYWNPRRPDGSLASIEDGSWKGDGQNPLEWIANNPLTYKKYKLFSMVFAEATPLRGLTFRSQFNIDFSHTTGFGQSMPEYSPNLGDGSASRSSTDALTLQITNTVNYHLDIDGDHSLNFMLGQEGLDSHYEGFSVATAGQNNNKLTDLGNGTRATSWDATADNDYALLSFFGRGEYNYKDLYYADASLRTDASSRFGAQNRWAAFWSLSFMWNLRNAPFVGESTRSWLSFAQLAISTGTSGNSSIPNYDHLALVGGGVDYVGNAGVIPLQQATENLGWEKLWTTNLAVHLGFWNRLNADFELYNKYTSNMLMEVPQSYSDNGYGFRWSNVGAMVNRGAELSLSGSAVEAGDFVLRLNANVSYNRNRLTELYNGVQEYEMSGTSRKLVVGHDVGEYYINRFAGVNPANGDALWYTKDGRLTTVLNDEDRVMAGKSQFAPLEGGFGAALSWKGLSLSAQFSWVADRWMINNDRYFNESNGRFQSYNQSRRLLDRWKEPGDLTDIPRHGIYTEFDSRLLEDASFLRLKNLMLSYSLPSELLRRIGATSGLRLYVQAQNLLTFTGFSGLDPESSSNIYIAQYPAARQFTFGLDLAF